MYLENVFSGYDSSGQQMTQRGRFLILFQLQKDNIGDMCCAENTYAIVRKVALQQFGHWMMGRANVGGKWITVSGSYGGDGMPRTFTELPHDAVRLPAELYELWAKGGGHNSAGNEAAAMRKWANETFK